MCGDIFSFTELVLHSLSGSEDLGSSIPETSTGQITLNLVGYSAVFWSFPFVFMQGAISGSNKIRGGSLRDTRNVAQSTVTDDDAYKTKRIESNRIGENGRTLFIGV